MLAHRLLPTAQAQLNRRTAEQVVQEILQQTPVPTSDGGTQVQPQHQPGRVPYGRQQPGARRV